ncbi:MAG: HAD family phosphatase [Lachnospiraceae bacterium]|nr:HAD family phosphatase [Lachnospiraceae bacterium]
MIKLIVSDMDGTLFNSNQEISPYNLAAIQNARKNGVQFMVATGRSMETLQPTLDKYELQCSLILLNGAEVRDEHHNIISTMNIDENVLPSITKRLEELGYIAEITTNDGVQMYGTKEQMELTMGYRMICLDRTHTLTLEHAIEAGKDSVFMNVLTRNESLDDLLNKQLEIRKIIVFHPDREVNDRNREQLIKEFPGLSIVSSYPENIEINAKDAKKGKALEVAIEKLGFTKDEVAVFGDGLNDISMFELFPNSYAPTNAEYEVKKEAKEIIPSNNDDGVGKKINELLFHNKF